MLIVFILYWICQSCLNKYILKLLSLSSLIIFNWSNIFICIKWNRIKRLLFFASTELWAFTAYQRRRRQEKVQELWGNTKLNKISPITAWLIKCHLNQKQPGVDCINCFVPNTDLPCPMPNFTAQKSNLGCTMLGTLMSCCAMRMLYTHSLYHQCSNLHVIPHNPGPPQLVSVLEC